MNKYLEGNHVTATLIWRGVFNIPRLFRLLKLRDKP